MDIELSGALARLVQAATVTDRDVTALREIIWNDDQLPPNTIDALFMLVETCTIDARTWDDFFHEAVEHFLLNQQQPYGFLSQDNADWLHERLDRVARVKPRAMVELLVAILEAAENAPPRLKSYALAQIEDAIVNGAGTTRSGEPRTPGRIDDDDAALLRRLIFAPAGDEATIVSTGEADMLFRLKAATLTADNAPAWLTLFVQGVGNHLLAHSDYRPLPTEEAEWFIADARRNTPSLFRFLERTLPLSRLGTGTIVDAFASIFPADPYPTSLSISPSRSFTSDQAAWLKQHIAADGQTDAYEKALLTFVIEEAGSAPASLTSLLRQA